MIVKNCLIFGGSGQIGRNLIRKLAQNNYKITVVTRNIHQKSYKIKTWVVKLLTPQTSNNQKTKTKRLFAAGPVAFALLT